MCGRHGSFRHLRVVPAGEHEQGFRCVTTMRSSLSVPTTTTVCALLVEQTGKLLDVLSGHEGPVCGLALAPNQVCVDHGVADLPFPAACFDARHVPPELCCLVSRCWRRVRGTRPYECGMCTAPARQRKCLLTAQTSSASPSARMATKSAVPPGTVSCRTGICGMGMCETGARPVGVAVGGEGWAGCVAAEGRSLKGKCCQCLPCVALVQSRGDRH